MDSPRDPAAHAPVATEPPSKPPPTVFAHASGIPNLSAMGRGEKSLKKRSNFFVSSRSRIIDALIEFGFFIGAAQRLFRAVLLLHRRAPLARASGYKRLTSSSHWLSKVCMHTAITQKSRCL